MNVWSWSPTNIWFLGFVGYVISLCSKATNEWMFVNGKLNTTKGISTMNNTKKHPKDRVAFMFHSCGSVLMGCEDAAPWNYYCPTCDQRYDLYGNNASLNTHDIKLFDEGTGRLFNEVFNLFHVKNLDELTQLAKWMNTKPCWIWADWVVGICVEANGRNLRAFYVRRVVLHPKKPSAFLLRWRIVQNVIRDILSKVRVQGVVLIWNGWKQIARGIT